MFLPLKGVHINNFSMHRNIMFFEKHVDRFFSENNDTTQENCETLQLVINAWMPKAYTFLLFTFFEFISTIIRWHRYSFPICFIYTYSNHSRDFILSLWHVINHCIYIFCMIFIAFLRFSLLTPFHYIYSFFLGIICMSAFFCHIQYNSFVD